jgi:CSLREA domain-containing protein
MKIIRFLINLRSFLILPTIILVFAISANAATFVVTTTADTQDLTAGNGVCADAAGACSLRAAITEANALAGADVITLPAGTYTITLAGAGENNNASGDFDLSTEITINGAGSGSTIVQAAASRGVATERVFHLRASFAMALNDMTVRYGRYTTAAGTFGAGIRVDTAAVVATLTNVVVTENDDGTSGGGIAVSGTTAGASLTLNNCTVSNNTAGGTAAGSSTGAGIHGSSATATMNINNSTITGNTVSNTSTTVSASAGGISSIGTTNITDSMITNNTATSSGSNTFSGGVHVTAGTTIITGSTISGNMSTVTAGAGSGFAGGIYNQQATVSIINSTVSGNSASSFHGGIRTLASTTAAATTNITNSTVSGNTSVGEGGGVINIAGSTFNSITNITGSTISGNMATSGTSLGGGIENFTVSTGLGTVNLTNSTVSGNSANNGAGVYNSGTTATINSNYSTVASNTAATNGGGIFQDTGGATNLKNSIVGDNTAGLTGPDIFGTITSQDYNHVEDTTGGTFFTELGGKSKLITTSFFALANDVTGTDPQLGALMNNGGTTNTHLPGITSPVLNTIPNGTSDCGTVITTSQNAAIRPQQGACEKGSAESLATTAANVSIGGRVITSSGRGIGNAFIEVSGGSLGQSIFVRTNKFGNYRIMELEAGQTYILTVHSKQFQFSTPTQIINLNDNISDFNFISN